ncbi:MAG: SDR family oxidoreductase [Roseiarcus sp.]
MDLGIAGRKAIVCASSRGLGRACARALAEAGCSVVVNGRDAATLEATAREIRQATGAEVVAVLGDLDSAEVRDALLEACPAPDILVNNNGGPPPAPFTELTRERILRGIESNMLTPIALIQRAAPGMAERRFGRIVNITSSSVRAPIAGLDVSSGARAGLTAFVAASARALAKDNVTINSIQPGAFDTDRIRLVLRNSATASGADPAALRAKREATIPAGRFGAPDEFGALCAFLCSAHAGYLTGQNILIDGGAFPGAF